MPDRGSHSLFNLESLLPFLEQGYVVLTPNLRLARHIKAQWSQRQISAGLTSWTPPTVMPLDSWLLTCWQVAAEAGQLQQRLRLSPAQVAELWAQIIEDPGEGEALNLLRPEAAATLAEQARDSLLRWRVDVHARATHQLFQFDLDCDTFLGWLERFEATLHSRQLATSADCLQELLEHEPTATFPVVLVEIASLSPLQEALLSHLSKDLQVLESEGELAPGEVRAYPDRRSELQAMAAWALRLHASEPWASVGLVLPDMDADRDAMDYLLRREFGCLGGSYESLPVNFSSSITLLRAPLVRDALLVLQLGLERVAAADVIALMQSRFLHDGDSGGSVGLRLAARLQEWGQGDIAVDELRNLANRMSRRPGRESSEPEDDTSVAARLMAMAGMRELKGRRPPSGWGSVFNDVLKLWSWPAGHALDSIEYQQLETWYGLLDQFGQYDAVYGDLNYGQALGLLRRACEREAAHPQTADSNIQVLGTLEAAGLHFDYLWICGLQASRWPAPVQPNPLIPLRLQRDRDMPHSSVEREWHFAETLLLGYRRAVGTFVASYATQVDGAEELPSALLREIVNPVEVANASPVPVAWTEQLGSTTLQVIASDIVPPVSADELPVIRGGSSLIENQSQCPFRAFARHRLHVSAPGELTAALSPAERGSLLHEALYLLWGQLEDSEGLHKLTVEEEQQLCSAVSAEALTTLDSDRRRAVGAACVALETQRLTSLLGEWLAVERSREAEFRVTQREHSQQVTLGPLTVKLQVDRIDTLADERQVIIDYKSSLSKVTDWLGERPRRPQLLLYGLAAESHPSALAFAQVRTRDCQFVGLGETEFATGVASDIPKATRGRAEAADWEQLNTLWGEHLQRLADEFLAGQADVDPLGPDTCTWCGLQSLCRVNHPVEVDA